MHFEITTEECTGSKENKGDFMEQVSNEKVLKPQKDSQLRKLLSRK